MITGIDIGSKCPKWGSTNFGKGIMEYAGDFMVGIIRRHFMESYFPEDPANTSVRVYRCKSCGNLFGFNSENNEVITS